MTVLVARRITGGENCSSLYEKVTTFGELSNQSSFQMIAIMHEKLNTTDGKLRVSDNFPLI